MEGDGIALSESHSFCMISPRTPDTDVNTYGPHHHHTNHINKKKNFSVNFEAQIDRSGP